jgi:hypothetical protein
VRSASRVGIQLHTGKLGKVVPTRETEKREEGNEKMTRIKTGRSEVGGEKEEQGTRRISKMWGTKMERRGRRAKEEDKGRRKEIGKMMTTRRYGQSRK